MMLAEVRKNTRKIYNMQSTLQIKVIINTLDYNGTPINIYNEKCFACVQTYTDISCLVDVCRRLAAIKFS